jgi:sugar/nucleoside kinase (ribokinase family)
VSARLGVPRSGYRLIHALRVPDVQLVGRLQDLGAQLVSLRCGADGTMVSQRDGSACAVPAVPGTKVVDPTGCGNAFCGGFLAALQAGEPLEAAAQWGCVAASFLANCQAVPDCTPSELRLVAAERLHSLKHLTRHVSL